MRYGAIGLALLVILGGTYIYMRHQATGRAEALAQAKRIDDAVISPTPQPPNLTFPTQEAKDKAWMDAFTNVAAKYRGTNEGAFAGIFLAARQSDAGNMAAAEKLYKDVMDSAP